MTQVQPTVNIHKAGKKLGVAFTSLQQLQRFEPEVFKLFKQIKDGERVETYHYSYKLRNSGRFGISLTRFAKDSTTTTQLPAQQPTQEQSIINTGNFQK